MAEPITLNVINSNNEIIRKFTCLTENKAFINSIITIGENNTIKTSDIDLLNNVAKRSGDAGIIEQSDLNGSEKKSLAFANNFGKYYDIEVSQDGKYLQVKIKDAGLLCKNPNLDTIKSDFGIRDNVLVKEGYIPHGNEGVIPRSTYGSGYDAVELSVGDTINLPVSEINISGEPRGAVSRFISWLSN